MIRNMYADVAVGLVSVAILVRAANGPHAGADHQNKMVWTNSDLEKLHNLGLISTVGREREDAKPTCAPANTPYLKTQEPDWYSAQAEKYRRVRLCEYPQALDDAQTLTKSTAGLDLVDKDFAITPEAGVGILQWQVSETQSDLDALEDLARRNDVEPGTFRGQRFRNAFATRVSLSIS